MGKASGSASQKALYSSTVRNPQANWVATPAIAAARYCRPDVNRMRKYVQYFRKPLPDALCF